MTPDDMRNARGELGTLWGKARPLHASELARALRLTGRDPGATVLAWERGKYPISGPVSCLIELYLRGILPPDGIPTGGHRPD